MPFFLKCSQPLLNSTHLTLLVVGTQSYIQLWVVSTDNCSFNTIEETISRVSITCRTSSIVILIGILLVPDVVEISSSRIMTLFLSIVLIRHHILNRAKGGALSSYEF